MPSFCIIFFFLCLKLLAWLSPNTEAHARRTAIFQYTRSVVQDCFGSEAKTVLIGSCALKTYLPDADIDMSVFVPKTCDGATDPVASLTAHICTVMQKQQAERAAAATAAAATDSADGKKRCRSRSCRRDDQCTLGAQPLQFHSVTCISAETCVIKCIVDNTSVDITFGQENAVASLELFERFDASFIAQDHILKKSILLLKAWFCHDAWRAASDLHHSQGNSPARVGSASGGVGGHGAIDNTAGGAIRHFSSSDRMRRHALIYGAKDGGLCTYALNTMVTCLLNTHDVKHPLQAFILFFKVFADFDWNKFYVTLFGFVPLGSRSPMDFLGGSPNKASPGQTLKMGVQQVRASGVHRMCCSRFPLFRKRHAQHKTDVADRPSRVSRCVCADCLFSRQSHPQHQYPGPIAGGKQSR